MKIILTCCLLLSIYASGEESVFVKKIMIHESEFAEVISKNEQLYLDGFGGQLQNNIKKISLSYTCYRKLTAEQVKSLVVKNATEFLNIINKDSELKPYIPSYPLTFKNLDFSITFVNEDQISSKSGFSVYDNNFIKEPYVASAYILHGKLYVQIWDKKKQNLVDVISEQL